MNVKNKAERVKKRRRRVRDNVQIAVLLVLALFFLTLCRYGWVQIVKGAEMSERVRMQSGEERVAQSPRGAILDTNGRELAVSSMTKSLFVDPSHVGDAAQLAADLAPIVGLSEADILEDIEQGGGFGGQGFGIGAGGLQTHQFDVGRFVVVAVFAGGFA